MKQARDFDQEFWEHWTYLDRAAARRDLPSVLFWAKCLLYLSTDHENSLKNG